MAGQRLTDKTALAANPANADNFMVVDTSDTSSSSAGTSKKVLSKYIIQTDKISVSNAEYKALDTAAKTLVAAPGAGYMVVPLAVTALYTEGGTANTAGTNLLLGWKAINATYYWENIKWWSKSPSYNGISWVFSGQSSTPQGQLDTSIADEPFLAWLSAAPTATATGIVDFYVTYQIVKI